MTSRVLAFDAGRSECRAALFEGTNRVASAVTPGTIGVAAANGVEMTVGRLLGAVRGLDVDLGELDACGAGLAGVAQTWSRAGAVAESIKSLLNPGVVVVASDVVTAHAGALGGKPGVVVVAGTGAVALALTEDGKSVTADGWGHLLGDDGSGFSVGEAGLRGALRAADGRDGSQKLLERAVARFGSLEGLIAAVHGNVNPSQLIASFTIDVADVARAGDEYAQKIWEEAGRSLAFSAASAALQAFGPEQDVAISHAGSVFRADDLLGDAFRAELAQRLPNGRLLPPSGDALEGARLLATGEVDEPLGHLRFRLGPDSTTEGTREGGSTRAPG